MNMKIDKLAELEAKMEALKKEIEETKKGVADFEALPPNKKLAIFLHERTCHYNHTDGCGWMYNIDAAGIPKSWTSNEAERYLSKANRIIAKFIQAMDETHWDVDEDQAVPLIMAAYDTQRF